MAGDVLLTAMDFYFEDGRSVPLPLKSKKVECWCNCRPVHGQGAAIKYHA